MRSILVVYVHILPYKMLFKISIFLCFVMWISLIFILQNIQGTDKKDLISDKENLSRWWGEDRENPRDEPLSLDRALARSRREVHLEGFPILTSSTWLIIYLAYFLPKCHFNQMFFGLQSIWHIYRVGKCRLTSLSDVITTCVRTHSRTSNG